MSNDRPDETRENLDHRVANRLRGLRVAKGWSQAQLAVRLGVKAQVLSRYESRSRSWPLALAIEAADVLGVTLGDIVSDQGLQPLPLDDLTLLWTQLLPDEQVLVLSLVRQLTQGRG